MNGFLVVGLIALTLGGLVMAVASHPRQWLVTIYTVCGLVGAIGLWVLVVATLLRN